jgi:hypothetical protein
MAQQVREADIAAELSTVPPASSAASSAGQRWWRWPLYATLVLLYTALWAFSAHFKLSPTDLDVFFMPSAKVMLGGHPWLAYSVRYTANYPNANGPLSLLPLTFAAWVAQRGGWLSDPTSTRIVVMVIFTVFPLLMSYEAVRAVDRLRGVPLQGARRVFAYAVFALTPQLWHSTLLYGHIEQPIEIWLVLVSLRLLTTRRAGWSGVCLGLALLARTAAIVLCIPLVLYPLCRRRWREAAWQLGGVALTVVLGLLPFWLADRADVLWSLLTFRGSLDVGGGSLWGLAVSTPWEAFAKAHDSLVVMAAVALICLLVYLTRPSLDLRSREIMALLTICAFCFPLLIKTMWPYYFLEPYVLLAIWWLAQPLATSRRTRLLWICDALLTMGVIGIAQLGELGKSQPGVLSWMRLWSLAVTIAIVLAMLLLAALGLVPWHRRRVVFPPTVAPPTVAPPTSEAVPAGYNA